MKAEEMTDEIVWAATGRYFGYPACCIADFIRRAKAFSTGVNACPLTKAQHVAHKELGFVPCPHCADRLLISREASATLIHNRMCPSSFPSWEDGRTVAKHVSKHLDYLYANYQTELSVLLTSLKPQP